MSTTGWLLASLVHSGYPVHVQRMSDGRGMAKWCKSSLRAMSSSPALLVQVKDKKKKDVNLVSSQNEFRVLLSKHRLSLILVRDQTRAFHKLGKC